MKFLGLTQDVKDLTSKEYVAQQIESEGGKIDTISVDGVQQPIIEKNVNIDLSAKADVSALATKTTQEIINANGKSQIMNESDGGGIWFVKNDNTSKSFVGVNDSTAGGPDAQIYAIDPSNSNYGAKVDILKDGIYYTVGSASYTDRIKPENKIAVKSDVDAIDYQIEKLAEAETGYLATYQLIDKDGAKCGASINIAKDLVISKAELKTCTEEGVPEGCHIGDKYIDFTVNTLSGATHIYLNVKDLVDVYTGGNGIAINSDRVVSAVVVESNGLSVDADGIKMSVADSANNGAMTAEMVTKLAGIAAGAEVNVIQTVNSSLFEIDENRNLTSAKLNSITEGANKVEASTTNGNILIDGIETQVYNLPQISYNDLSDKPEIPVVPTNVSAFTNDAGYLTEHQSLSAYRTASDQNLIDAGKQATITDLNEIRSGAALGATAIQSHQDISGKVDKPAEPVVGQGVNVPYYFDVVYAEDKATVRDYTVDLLNASAQPKVFSLDILSASQSNAGLLNVTDKAKIDNIDTSLASKQDIISDLEEIRNGAALGATSIQSHQSLSAYRTAAEQDAIHDSTKQDVISDISTIRSGAALGATAAQPSYVSAQINAEAESLNKWNSLTGLLTSCQSHASSNFVAGDVLKVTSCILPYDENSYYVLNDLCLHDGKYYQCDVFSGKAHGTWDPSLWIETTNKNLKPVCTKFTTTASTTYETNIVSLGDFYVFVNNEWVLNHGAAIIDTELKEDSNNALANSVIYKKLALKQNTISDLETIRSGAALGATSIQSHQDISGKQDVISDLADIRSGAALGATAIQTHQSLVTAADINVTNPVGQYLAGDTIVAGTSFEEILRKMLTTRA